MVRCVMLCQAIQRHKLHLVMLLNASVNLALKPNDKVIV